MRWLVGIALVVIAVRRIGTERIADLARPANQRLEVFSPCRAGPYARFALSVRPSRTPWRLTAALITVLLSACSPVANASRTPSQAAPGLPASSSGVCQAIAALPDVAATERIFINVAHAALHVLAADPRLDRSMSASVLETMQKVEADFRHSPGVPVLTDDLANLHASANTALIAIGEEVQACAL
jgi:hypothetical protein